MSWVSKEADQTYIAIGGLVVAIIVLIGLMLLHNGDTEKDLLSPEHIMAMIGLPGLILSYSVGKKVGEMTANGNGKSKGDAEQ